MANPARASVCRVKIRTRLYGTTTRTTQWQPHRSQHTAHSTQERAVHTSLCLKTCLETHSNPKIFVAGARGGVNVLHAPAAPGRAPPLRSGARPGPAARSAKMYVAKTVPVCSKNGTYVPVTQYIQSSPYFDPTHTRTGWIGQPPILNRHCLLYTSPSPRDQRGSRMPSSA